MLWKRHRLLRLQPYRHGMNMMLCQKAGIWWVNLQQAD